LNLAKFFNVSGLNPYHFLEKICIDLIVCILRTGYKEKNSNNQGYANFILGNERVPFG
jgi:hypothetical protein